MDSISTIIRLIFTIIVIILGILISYHGIRVIIKKYKGTSKGLINFGGIMDLVAMLYVVINTSSYITGLKEGTELELKFSIFKVLIFIFFVVMLYLDLKDKKYSELSSERKVDINLLIYVTLTIFFDMES